jgi:hypothetical protein
MITALCAPVTIAYDPFLSDHNWQQFLKERESNVNLQDDIDMFIVGYENLRREGIILDLHGDENLVVTRE